MLEHDVGELVVAMHESRHVIDRSMRSQPRGGLVQPGELACRAVLVDPFQEGGPAVDLAIVEAIRSAEVAKTRGTPVDPGEAGDPVDQLEGESGSCRRIRRERFGPTGSARPGAVHGGPAVDEPHEVERSAEHRRIRADGDCFGVRHVGAVEGFDDPPLPKDPVVARCGSMWRRDAQRGPEVAT